MIRLQKTKVELIPLRVTYEWQCPACNYENTVSFYCSHMSQYGLPATVCCGNCHELSQVDIKPTLAHCIKYLPDESEY